MIISNCPRCQERFRVPLGTMPEDAYAMCPWCQETFPLVEVLNHLPPALHILTADGEPIAIMEPVASDSAAALPSLASGSIAPSDYLQTSDGAGNDQQWDPTGLNFGAESRQAEGGWNLGDTSQTAPMHVSPGPNRRKKGGSGIRSMVQVVVGGLLSVPIALGILLAVGRAPDLGFWPFDGQARSPRELLPFIENTDTNDQTTFPSFEGQQLDTTDFDEAMKETQDPSESALEQIFAPDDSPDSDDQSNLDEMAPTNPLQTAFRKSTETTPDPTQPKELNNPPELPNPLANGNTDSRPVIEPESAGSKIADNDTDSATTVIAASQIKPSEKVIDENVESKSLDSVPAKLMVEITAAIQAIKTLDAEDQVIDTDRLAEAYESIAKACEVAQEHPAALSSLATAVSQSTALNQIQEAAVTWLDYPERSTQGIIVIGKPGATAKSQILTIDSGRVLTISGKLTLPLAETVVVLGQLTGAKDEIRIGYTEPLP